MSVDDSGYSDSGYSDVPPVMTTAEAAELLRWDVRTVLNAIRDHGLPAHRPQGGRKYVILRDELLDWIRAT